MMALYVSKWQFNPVTCHYGDPWRLVFFTLPLPCENRKKTNSCTCFMLSVTFAPAAPLHTWECIDKCPYVVHWLTGIDDVTLFVMVTKTKPLQCALTRARWAGQREQHPPEKIFIQIIVRRQTQIRFLVGCSFFLLPNRNRCGRHSKALQNLNSERNLEF